jgi:hypothetical protein
MPQDYAVAVKAEKKARLTKKTAQIAPWKSATPWISCRIVCDASAMSNSTSEIQPLSFP